MVALVCSLGVGVALAQETPPAVAPLPASPAATAPAADPSAMQFLLALEQTMGDAIAKAERSVVSISHASHRPLSARDLRLSPFGGPRQDDALDPRSTDFVPDKWGTGVVIDRRGLVLTNFHVLDAEEGAEHWITTIDRKVFRARIKGADARSDLAVLEVVDQVAEGDFTPINYGDASRLRKGQIVLALGNPYALARDGQASVSWGIISNLARKLPPNLAAGDARDQRDTLHHFGTLIQTDAKLNLGTSGGPLINLRGEMIGLVTSQAALAGYEQAAGYAIPVDDTFRRVVDTLAQGAEVEYGLLGVQTRNLTMHEQSQGHNGVRVTGVAPISPARRVGIESDDLITHVDGQPIHDVDSLMLGVGKLAAASPASITVERGGRSVELHVTLAKYPVRGPQVVTAPRPAWRGLRVDFVRAQNVMPGPLSFGFPPPVACVEIIEVEQDSAAWKAGLRPGMLVVGLGEVRVENPNDFRAAAATATGEVTLALLPRGTEPRSITVPAP